MWAKRLSAASEGPTSQVRPNVIKVKSNGEIILAGGFYSTTDFNPGTGTHTVDPGPGSGMFIAKYTSNGNFLWVETSESTNGFNVSDLGFDNFENIYLTGQFTGTMDFDPSVATFTFNSPSYVAAFVLKLDPYANFIWAKTFQILQPGCRPINSQLIQWEIHTQPVP